MSCSAMKIAITYEVHGLWISWKFPLFFFEFADHPIMETLSVILVWAYREQCVHL